MSSIIYIHPRLVSSSLVSRAVEFSCPRKAKAPWQTGALDSMSFPPPQVNPCQRAVSASAHNSKTTVAESRNLKITTIPATAHVVREQQPQTPPRTIAMQPAITVSIFSFYNTPGQKPRDDCGQRGKGRLPASVDLTPKCFAYTTRQTSFFPSLPPPSILASIPGCKGDEIVQRDAIFPQSAIEATRLHVFANAPPPSIHPSMLYVLAFRAYNHNCMDGVGTGKPLVYKGHGRPSANKCRQIERSRGPLLTAHLQSCTSVALSRGQSGIRGANLERGRVMVRRNELDLTCFITVNLL